MKSDSEATSPSRPPPFVEVSLAGGIRRRFAAGTKAGFAIDRINQTEPETSTRYSFITAVKEGEEAVEFGPDAELVSYGEGWKLETVQDMKVTKSIPSGSSKVEAKDVVKSTTQPVRKFNPADFYPGGNLPVISPPEEGWAYFWNLSSVIGIIVLGIAFWVYLLENQFFMTT